jgi:hypothetical protein
VTRICMQTRPQYDREMAACALPGAVVTRYLGDVRCVVGAAEGEQKSFVPCHCRTPDRNRVRLLIG